MNLMLIIPSLIHRLANFVKTCGGIISVSLIILGFPSTAAAQTGRDSADVMAQVEKYKSVWDEHYPATLSEFYTEDADFIMGNQPLLYGRKAIMDWWSVYFKRQEPERRLGIDLNSFRVIADNVVLLNVTTTTHGKDSKGKTLLSRKARGTWVLHRQNGRWFITAIRGMPSESDRIIRLIGR